MGTGIKTGLVPCLFGKILVLAVKKASAGSPKKKKKIFTESVLMGIDTVSKKCLIDKKIF
jgi:hypothetical protein